MKEQGGHRTRGAAALVVSDGHSYLVNRDGTVRDRANGEKLGYVWRAGDTWYANRLDPCECYVNVGRADEQKCGRRTTDHCIECRRPLCGDHRTWWDHRQAWACQYPRHA